jgi:putative membrane protein
MSQKKIFLQLLGASALSMMLVASPVIAQSTSAQGNTGERSSAASSAGSSSSADNAKSSRGSSVESQDKEFMEDIAHANLAEIETGKLALEKSQSDEVKKFAQMMINEHTKAQKELESLAQKKGITLPTETDMQHKTIATALQALSGDTFDKQYIARVGVGDHERTLKLLQKTEKQTKDKELKAYASKTIKSVKKHLEHAKKMEGKSK